MISVIKHGTDTVELLMVGDMKVADYQGADPALEEALASGKKKFLVDLTSIGKFSPGAVLQDIRMDLKYIRKIGATAVISNKTFFKVMSKIAHRFFPENIQHFTNRDEAIAWLKQQKIKS